MINFIEALNYLHKQAICKLKHFKAKYGYTSTPSKANL